MIRMDGTGQVNAGIEITPQMVEAGVIEARVHCLGSPLADMVTSVYVAMRLEDMLRASAS